MTPWHHAESSAKKFGGQPEEYMPLHQFFDETKQYTGDWTHRALRHHSAGVEWAIAKFGHTIPINFQAAVPTKLIAEQHIMEDCGFIPTVQDWLRILSEHPADWMLRVKTKSHHKMVISDDNETDDSTNRPGE